MPAKPKTKKKSIIARTLAPLDVAQRALLMRASIDDPEAMRVTEEEVALAEGLWKLGLLRPAMIGNRYAWRLRYPWALKRNALLAELIPND